MPRSWLAMRVATSAGEGMARQNDYSRCSERGRRAGTAECLNPPRQRRRQLRVDEESQLCVPKNGVIVLTGGEFQHRRDVFVFEVGIVAENLFSGRASSEQIEHVLHTDTEPANAWATATHFGIRRDSVNAAHLFAQRASSRADPFYRSLALLVRSEARAAPPA
jgi:hypothetical protein